MSYKILIVNNDDGKVIVDEKEARAIVGAVSYDKQTQALGLTDCNALDLVCTMHVAETTIDTLTKKNPDVAMLLALLRTDIEE